MNRTAFSALAAASAFLLIGGPATAQTKAPNKPHTPINDVISSVDVRFMKKAAQGNIAEIMMGELAMKKSPTKSVRETGMMIAKDHRTAQAQLKQVAAKENVALPSQPNAMQKAVYRRLSRLSGAAFDREYIRAQAKAHLDAINLYQMENSSGRVGDAVAYARETLPVIQNHTSHVTEVAAALNVPLPRPANAYAKEQGSVTAARESAGKTKPKKGQRK